VIVDHVDGHTDGMAVFDGIYKILGHELLPFLFLAAGDKSVYQQFSLSIGTMGLIKKPLQPNEALAILKKLIPPSSDPATSYALVISKLMLKGELNKAASALPKLFSSPVFKAGAEVALTRCELHLGQMVQAHGRLHELLEKKPKNIRLLCELAEFHVKNAQFEDAVKIYDQIHDLHPQMNIKIWDQILMLIELDRLDAACSLLDGLLTDPTFKDLATEGLTHLMSFLGMHLGIPGVLRSQPELLKQYTNYVNVPLSAKG
jgi:tetratricopeptide (TPR) repeat protein